MTRFLTRGIVAHPEIRWDTDRVGPGVVGDGAGHRAPCPRGTNQAASPRAEGSASAEHPAAEGRFLLVTVEDGDNVLIRWNDKDTEIIRILGIDTPEIRRLEHNLPYDQPFGLEAKAFAQGALAAATDIELIRSPTLDPYGRTLAYLFINGRNFSVMVIKAKYSGETVSHYGDNGLPKESAEVLAAAKEVGAGPLPFEPPYQFRARMRTLTEALKQSGHFPNN